jgi:DNA-binding NtrC family response regulator
MRKILIVDDDPNVADVIEQYFESPEYDVCTMLEGEKVPETVSRIKPDLILLDLKLPDVNGMDVLKKLRNVGLQTPVVIITGNVSAGVAMEAMKEGAYEYLPKPFSLDELGKLVDKLLEKSIHSPTTSLPEDRGYGPQKNEELVGRSPEILKIGKMIGQVAFSEASILLTGERGTGKEFIAKIIHQNSRGKDKPFVVVNCTYPSPEMLEEELFGRGGQPDSVFGGKLQSCNGGTLFLDDIEGMSLSNQDKLLRAMKMKEIVTQGNKTLKLDIRIIAASSRDLSERVRQGEFMQELLYNLRVISIHLPPLRERNSDIPLLAEHFLKSYCRQTDKMIPHISTDAMKLLMSYSWPGNVGELENNIHSAVVMCKGDQILPEHLPIHFQGNVRVQLSFQKGGNDYPGLLMQTLEPVANKLFQELKGKVHAQLVEALEKALISLALNRCQGNQVKAADILGISRNTLRERMLKFGLSKKEKIPT